MQGLLNLLCQSLIHLMPARLHSKAGKQSVCRQVLFVDFNKTFYLCTKHLTQIVSAS